MPKSNSGKTVNYRSAVDGQYVPKSKAESKPRETVKETERKTAKPKKGR